MVTAAAILAGLAVSLLIGLFNGWIIAYIGVSPILATLGTMMLIQGLNVVITKGYVISGFPEPVLFIGNGLIFGVPVPLLIFTACVGLAALILRRTPFGIAIYIKVILKIYALSGLLCGVAALIMISRFNSAKAGYASSYLLVTILAAVLGGVDPFGGFGKMMGLVLALLILQVVSSGLNLIGISAHLTLTLWGGILIFILFINQVREWFAVRKRLG